MALTEQLTSLLGKFSISSSVIGAAAPGQITRFSILSNVTGLSILDSLGTAPLVGSVTGPITGSLSSTLPAPVGDLTMTADNLLLDGTLSGATDLLRELQMAVKVEWFVYRRTKRESTLLTQGQDYLSNLPDGIGPVLDLLVTPFFVELTTTPPAPSKIRVEAKVTLTANFIVDATLPDPPPPTEVTLPLPAFSFDLLPIEIPRVLLLFRNPYFLPVKPDGLAGFLLVCVPGGSPICGAAQGLNDLLLRLDTTLAPLRPLGKIAAFLTKLTLLRQALAGQPTMRLIPGDMEGSGGLVIKNFNRIRIQTRSFLTIDALALDDYANNSISSLIYLGLPRVNARCYAGADHEEESASWMELQPDATLIVIIDNLDKRVEENQNIWENVIVHDQFSGDTGVNFNNSFSSIKFM